MDASDQDLWTQWTAGDRDAGDALVRRYFVRIHRFLASKVGDAAEELTQRTFEGALASRDRYRGDAPFRGYLFGIARKQVLRHYEGRGRDLGGIDPAELSVHDLGPSPSKLIGGKEREALILEALQRIPLGLQIVLELHYWERMKVLEIAAALEIPRGTVMSRLHRGRAAIKKQLQEIAPKAPEIDLEQDTQAVRDAILGPGEGVG
ncbi:MAG: RNA polymerase sigma factor [Myxococcota bacterium]